MMITCKNLFAVNKILRGIYNNKICVSAYCNNTSLSMSYLIRKSFSKREGEDKNDSKDSKDSHIKLEFINTNSRDSTNSKNTSNFIKSEYFDFSTNSENTSNIDEDETPKNNLTFKKIHSYIKHTNELIVNKKLMVKNLPDPNFFNGALIYTSMDTRNYSIVAAPEKSGLALMTGLSFLSYCKIVFQSPFWLYFYGFLTSAFYLRYFLRPIVSIKHIYHISLMNENKVRISYLNGKRNETVNIKDISFSVLPSPQTPDFQINLHLKINNKTAIINLKTYLEMFSKDDLMLLLGILNEDTEEIAFI